MRELGSLVISVKGLIRFVAIFVVIRMSLHFKEGSVCPSLSGIPGVPYRNLLVFS